MKKSEYIKNKYVFAHDPSMTGWGWVVMDFNKNVIDKGIIKTVPEAKKRRIRVSDDRCRRISEITRILVDVIKKYNIGLIVSEAPHGSQNASAATMIGITATIPQMLAIIYDIPIEWYSEGDSKKQLLGKNSATKKETIDKIKSLYKVPWYNIKYKDEAVADAISIYHVASIQSEMFKILRNQ